MSEFKDLKGNPISEDELWEELVDYWEEDFLDYIIREIKFQFGGDYKAWKKWFFNAHELCEGFHDIEWWTLKETLLEIDGVKYCPDCVDILEDERKRKEECEG